MNYNKNYNKRNGNRKCDLVTATLAQIDEKNDAWALAGTTKFQKLCARIAEETTFICNYKKDALMVLDRDTDEIVFTLQQLTDDKTNEEFYRINMQNVSGGFTSVDMDILAINVLPDETPFTRRIIFGFYVKLDYNKYLSASQAVIYDEGAEIVTEIEEIIENTLDEDEEDEIPPKIKMPIKLDFEYEE